jgi:tRNA-uridine 2-sulfurtransferase
MSTKSVVAVAMSGGVDSSVAAALLVESGYQVIGIMLRLWSEQDAEQSNRCCTPDSMAQARRVASILSIPFYVIDARQIFFDSVVNSFINGYTHNRTPNPCLTCNRVVRWDFLLKHALAAGADFLATGHYARISNNSENSIFLSRGVDHSKDQSYVLHVLTQPQLNHAQFPLGDYLKQDVRLMAHKFNLPVAERPDSQDLCFIGMDGDYRRFLTRYAPDTVNPGLIMNQHGQVIGSHQGLAFFTIGQRKGLHISSPVPLYVLAKDTLRNILFVGTREELGNNYLVADQVNWIDGQPPASSFNASVKVRYNARDVLGFVRVINEHSIRIEFENLVPGITPGQAAVLYNGDICLGGGIIDNYNDVIF